MPNIAGYDVYLTEDSELPEAAWRFLPLNSPEPEISLDDLRRSATYFIKIKIRKIDGTVIESPSIYKFTTVGEWFVIKFIFKFLVNNKFFKINNYRYFAENVPQFPMESRLPDLLSYSNVGTGRVSINWAFQSSINDRVSGVCFYSFYRKFRRIFLKLNFDIKCLQILKKTTHSRYATHSGSRIHYTENHHQPLERWQKFDIKNSQQVSLFYDFIVWVYIIAERFAGGIKTAYRLLCEDCTGAWRRHSGLR